MFIFWIALGVLAGLAFGFITRATRDEAIHNTWRARLVQAENTIDLLRSEGNTEAGKSGEEDKGLSLMREQLLKCESEKSAALAKIDQLKPKPARKKSTKKTVKKTA